jgi:hypothetical protein
MQLNGRNVVGGANVPGDQLELRASALVCGPSCCKNGVPLNEHRRVPQKLVCVATDQRSTVVKQAAGGDILILHMFENMPNTVRHNLDRWI